MVHINLSISYQITNHIEIEDGSHQFVHILSNHKSHWNWGWFTSICPYLIKSQITLKLRMVHINLSISYQITNHIEIEDGSHQFVHILSNHKSHWNWGWFTSICPYQIKSQITLKLRMVHINLSISYQITNHIEIEDGSHQFVHIKSNHKSHWNWGWFTSICPYLIKSQITLKLRMVHINLSISYQITNHIEIEDGSHQFVHILSNHKSHWNWGWFTSICPYQIKSQITLKLRMVHINLSISYQITNHIEIEDGSHQFVHIISYQITNHIEIEDGSSLDLPCYAVEWNGHWTPSQLASGPAAPRRFCSRRKSCPNYHPWTCRSSCPGWSWVKMDLRG